MIGFLGIPDLEHPADGQVPVHSTVLGRARWGGLPSSGLSGLTANRIPYGNTTGGLQDSANLTWDGTTLSFAGGYFAMNGGKLYGFTAYLNDQTGTSYTTSAADCGRLLTISNAGAIVVTLHSDAAVGFSLTVYQKGAGRITFTPDTGGTLRNYDSHAKTAGQYATCTLFVESNAGNAAVWVLGGRTGT